ncbi:hypothetical protein DSBG_0601 [Desulfosporosinus sp. BG]|nr:hypothetical protein DSBG_0601 [Desulfosporosinus sp. BG]
MGEIWIRGKGSILIVTQPIVDLLIAQSVIAVRLVLSVEITIIVPIVAVNSMENKSLRFMP